MARSDDRDLRLSWSKRLSLRQRILAVNIFAILILAGSLFYLDSFRGRLTQARVDQARTEAVMVSHMLSALPDRAWANALVRLGCSPAEMTWKAGIDILSLGGTKGGAMIAEAVVVLSPERVAGLTYLRKQSMQLASKMRFVSAQLLALFEGDLWRRNAAHANGMARRLSEAVADIDGVRLVTRVEANAVFPILPRLASERLMERFRFYFWDETTGQVRWMCAWDTTESDVDAFAQAVREELTPPR